MGEKYDIITALDLCVDFIVECGNMVPEFNQVEQLVESYRLELGGSACIFASQAARLGLKVAGVGTIGNDHFGKFVLSELGNNKVDTALIRFDNSIQTGVGIILNHNADRAILTFSGSIDGVDRTRFSDDLIKNTRHLHIGSYFLLNRLRPSLKEILLKCKSHNVTVSLDTNWDPLNKWDGGLSEILSMVDIFLPNENEARLISGKKDSNEAVKWLKDRIGIVVVKMGIKGASCYMDNQEYHHPCIDVYVTDTIGAGDSFDAGFIFGYLNGYPPEKCLKIATVCGSLSTRKSGGTAAQPSLEELNNYL